MHVPLEPGSTVAIVGGGPGGAAAAITLLRRAGGNLRVVVFEAKDFSIHHNQCVGVLSPPIDRILHDELQVQLPHELIRRQIYGYRLFGPTRDILLTHHRHPEPEGGATYAVRRADFDRFMLATARELGAEVVPSRVTHLEFVRQRGLDEVRIYSDSISVRCQAVIGAFGLDDSMLTAFERVTPYRRPPKLLQTYVAKLPSDTGFIRRRLGFVIQAYLLPTELPNVEFGAITPKDDYIIINIAGPRITSRDMDDFLRLPRVRDRLPDFDPGSLHYFSGWFPTAPARYAYGHRFAMVGDATGWMRPFKGKGINTALITGVKAAQTLLGVGVSRRDLQHYEGSCRELLRDYGYGITVRTTARLLSDYTLDPLIEAAATTPVLYDALYDAVSGHASYRDIIHRCANMEVVKRVASSALGLKRKEHRRAVKGQFTVERMTVRDIDEVMRLDDKIRGEPHPAYLESKVSSFLASYPEACLVARNATGAIIGFVLGSVRGWAYTLEMHGWLEVIGVDPDVRSAGVSRALLDQLFAYFKSVEVTEVHTVVNWNDGHLVDYFRAMGFERGEYVDLVRKI
jgi:flavin-dependent dehydrogenase/ribosomal protein S18 acetylase RimI-like enzyme